jgi:hypothetical protein
MGETITLVSQFTIHQTDTSLYHTSTIVAPKSDVTFGS